MPAGGRDHGPERARPGRDLRATSPSGFGHPVYRRIDAPATPGQKAVARTAVARRGQRDRARRRAVTGILTTAPGNGAPIGGLKVTTDNGWFAARPSGTEDVYKIYAESFRGDDHLERIIEEAQAVVGRRSPPAS